MNTVIDGKEQPASLDWEYFSPKEFYDVMRRGERITTTQVPFQEFETEFSKRLEQGYDIVYISCSSALSGSFGAGNVVAKDLMKKYKGRKVFCVDSLNACLGEGILAIKAAEYRDMGLNSAIILSRLVYGDDIPKKGSGNPGFTNFRRIYGNSAVAWSVMLLDILKTILPVLISAMVFESTFGMWHFGAAFSGCYCTIGHCFPIWYGFKGGKGFLTTLATLWIIDWRCGLIATCVLAILLLTAKYMSVATIVSLVSGAILLAVLDFRFFPVSVIFYCMCVVLMIVRHRKNIVRLIDGGEPKFKLKNK